MKLNYDSADYRTFCKEQKAKGLQKQHWKDLPQMWVEELAFRRDLEKSLGLRPMTPAEVRHTNGEGWVMCEECGGKLWSYDGDTDIGRLCPYRGPDGTCRPK